MKKTIVSVILAAVLPLSGFCQKLVILHTNDTHSHLEAFRDNGHGGVIERAAFIDSVRNAEGPQNVLLLDAGDISQGTPYFTLGAGVYEDRLVHAMGYDCLTMGNHEFDNGLDALADRYSRYTIPVVCANLTLKGTPLEPYVSPFVVIERGGLKIGIIGFAPSLKGLVSAGVTGSVKNIDAFKVGNKYAKILKKRYKCDLVIALSHLGYGGAERHAERECDMNLAAQTRNIDIIVGGHSHTDLKAPSYVENLDGKKVMVVQDFCWGEYVGKIDIKY